MSALEHDEEHGQPAARAFRLRLLVERLVDEGLDESEIVAAVSEAEADGAG
jgi:hypothetical protein